MAVISPISGLKTWLNSGETIFGGDLNSNFSILRGAFNAHTHSEFPSLVGENSSTANWNVSGNWNFSGNVETSGSWLNSGAWTNTGLHSFNVGPIFRGPPTLEFTGSPFTLLAGTIGQLVTGLNANMLQGLVANELRMPTLNVIRPATGAGLGIGGVTVSKPADRPGLIIAASSSGGGSGGGLMDPTSLGENGTAGGRLEIIGPVIAFELQGGLGGRAWNRDAPTAPASATVPGNITAGVVGGRAGDAGRRLSWEGTPTDHQLATMNGTDGGHGWLHVAALPATGGDINVRIAAPGFGGLGMAGAASGLIGNSGFCILMW